MPNGFDASSYHPVQILPHLVNARTQKEEKGVFWQLHIHRSHNQVTNKGASEQEKTVAVALNINDMAVWSHSCHPPGASHSSRHADFGVELEWNTPMDGIRGTNLRRPRAGQVRCGMGGSRTSHMCSGVSMVSVSGADKVS